MKACLLDLIKWIQTIIKFFIFFFIDLLISFFSNLFIWKVRRAIVSNDLSNKIVVITGATDGLGKLTAKFIASRGATIVLTYRNIVKAQQIHAQILEETNGNAKVYLIELDLSSLESVRSAANIILNTVDRVDVLINNGGIMQFRKQYSKDDHELHFVTNHLSHFLLTNLLLPLLKKSSNARVVTLSSSANLLGRIHFKDINLKSSFHAVLAGYSQSKIANILFVRELARRHPNINCYSLHPGMVRTKIFHLFPFYLRIIVHVFKYLFMIQPIEGIQTTLHCSFSDVCRNETGNHYTNCSKSNFFTSSRLKPQDDELLWNLSEEICKLNTK